MDVALLKNDSAKLDFEGWPLDLYSFNEEFDEAARERMVKGGRLLLKHIDEYLLKEKLGNYILEIGPFFNPLMTREKLGPGQRLAYWENDMNALRWLKEKHLCNQIFPVGCDVKEIGKLEFQFYAYPAFVESQNLTTYSGRYDSIIMSQILNYLDYRDFISQIRRFIKPGGLVFINNVVNYGIPDFFSPDRPASIEETIQTLAELGFEILEEDVLAPPRPKDDNRLLLVASYKGPVQVFP